MLLSGSRASKKTWRVNKLNAPNASRSVMTRCSNGILLKYMGGMSLKQGKDVIQKRVDDQHKRITNLFAWKGIKTVVLACLIGLNHSIYSCGIDSIFAKIRRIAEVLDIALSNCCTAIRRFDLVMSSVGSSSINLGYHDFMTGNQCLSYRL